MAQLEKVIFRLTVDDEGYPPVAYESVWAFGLTDSSYLIDDVPYYVYGVSKGDTVRANRVEGELFVSSVIARGGHSTLRVFADDTRIQASMVQELMQRGAKCSVTTGLSLFSVDIAPDVDFEIIDHFLVSRCDGEHIAYEDACLQHSKIDHDRIIECKSLATVPERFS